MTTIGLLGVNRRTRFLFDWCPSDLSLLARSNQTGASRRTTGTTAFDSNGVSYTVQPYAPAWDWLDLDGDGIRETVGAKIQGDGLYFDWDWVPGASTTWIDFVEHTPVNTTVDTRLLEFGDSGSAGAYWTVKRIMGGYEVIHYDGAAAVTATIPLTPYDGDRVTLRIVTDATGAVTIYAAINGAAETYGAASAAQAFPAAFNRARVSIGCDFAGANSANETPIRVRHIDGVQTAAFMGAAGATATGGASSAPALPFGIGTPGAQGFGVGICGGLLPAGMSAMAGTYDITSDNYGNYQYTDGSVMAWIPAFYYKWGTGSNGLALNAVDVKDYSYFVDVATANAAGYALHRAFYDGGAIKSGVFVDKYQCSNNGGVASSIKFGLPLTADSAGVHNPFSGLTGGIPNAYYGAIAAAKTRGVNFFCNSRFIFAALALLSYAHGQAATGTAACAWYDATGVTNFPKGNNNNALRDTNDTSVLYVSDGYPNCGQTGSANLFSRTTHNGQNCGVADLNGNVWEVTPGLATDSGGAQFYALKTAMAMKNMMGGSGGATDLWGTAAQLAPNYDLLGATYEAAQATATVKPYGAVGAQVLSEQVSGLAWEWAGLGAPLAAGLGGTNPFGNDGFWDYLVADLCPLSGGGWGNGAYAGVWAFALNGSRGSADNAMGFRAALYL